MRAIMVAPIPQRDGPGYHVERLEGPGVRTSLVFSGELRFRECFASWQDVRRLAAAVVPPFVLDIDLAGVEHLDGAATALLLELRAELERKGVTSEVVGATGPVRAML